MIKQGNPIATFKKTVPARSLRLQLLLILLLPLTGLAKPQLFHLDTLIVESGHLNISCHQEAWIREDLLASLQKGATAGLTYEFQLWERRNHWTDRLDRTRTIGIKAAYSNWDKLYVVSSRKDSLVWLNEKDFIEYCSSLDDFPVWPVNRLQEKSVYYMVIKSVLEPLSLDNLQDFRRWLTGEVEDAAPESLEPSILKRMGDWTARLIFDMAGFSNQVRVVKSRQFVIRNEQLIFRGDEQ